MGTKHTIQDLFSNGIIWNAEHFSQVRALSSHPKFIPTGLAAIDHHLPLGGLDYCGIHEWSLEDPLMPTKKYWYPPFLIVCAFFGNFFKHNSLLNQNKKYLAWVGRKSWPTPQIFEKTFPRKYFHWEDKCLFIDCKNKEQRLWAAIQALRSSSITAVVVDGSSLGMTALRKLQFAAREYSSLAIVFKPPWEISLASPAHTKWRIIPVPSNTYVPCWKMDLLRARGLNHLQSWTVKWNNKNECEGHCLCASSYTISGFEESSEEARTPHIAAH